MFDTAAYLRRIAYDGSLAPAEETLRALQIAHLSTVPFENLDIHRGQLIILDEDALFTKIVQRQRGGFCYELNGLFARLLRSLGFHVALLAAQFPREPGVFAPECDHLALRVAVPGDDTRWLVDVGAGRGSFLTPLRAEMDTEQTETATGVSFRLVQEGARWRLQRREAGLAWAPLYAVSPRPRRLADFRGGCHYHQTSPDSSLHPESAVLDRDPGWPGDDQ